MKFFLFFQFIFFNLVFAEPGYDEMLRKSPEFYQFHYQGEADLPDGTYRFEFVDGQIRKALLYEKGKKETIFNNANLKKNPLYKNILKVLDDELKYFKEAKEHYPKFKNKRMFTDGLFFIINGKVYNRYYPGLYSPILTDTPRNTMVPFEIMKVKVKKQVQKIKDKRKNTIKVEESDPTSKTYYRFDEEGDLFSYEIKSAGKDPIIINDPMVLRLFDSKTDLDGLLYEPGNAYSTERFSGPARGFYLRRLLHAILWASQKPEEQAGKIIHHLFSTNEDFFKLLSNYDDFLSALSEMGLPEGRPKKVLKTIALLLFENEFTSKHLHNLWAEGGYRREKLHNILKYAPYKTLAKKINKTVRNFSLSEGELVKQMTNIKLPKGANDNVVELIKRVTQSYFDGLPLENRYRILLNFLELDPNAGKAKQMAAVLNGSGPILQKMFQLVGDKIDDPFLHEAAKEMKTNVKPIEWDIAKPLIEKNLGNKIENIFSNFPKKAIQSGSIGQVYLWRLKNGEEVIVKVRRPGVYESAKKEYEIMVNLLNNPEQREILKSAKNVLFEELDFNIERAHLKKAEAYIRPTMGIDVVKNYEIKQLENSSEVLLMTKASGTPFSDQPMVISFNSDAHGRQAIIPLSREQVLAQKNALVNLIDRWTTRLFFEDGFYHGDIHGGNAFYTQSDESPGFKLTMIDFGNSGNASVEMKRGFINLGLAADFIDPEKAINALSKITQISQVQRKEILKAINNLPRGKNWKDLDKMKRINVVFGIAINKKVNVPAELMGIGRSFAFLEILVSNFNKNIDYLGKKHGKISPIKKQFLYSKVFVRESVKDVLGHLKKDRSRKVLVDKCIRSMIYELVSSKMKSFSKIK